MADLGALFIPPQEVRLRRRFGLAQEPLRLITSGWHRLVVATADRVFVFPRHGDEVPGVEREARVLAEVQLEVAPRLLGLHRDTEISPYPFLELTLIPGRPYGAISDELTETDAATALESLARRVAEVHCTSVPDPLASSPPHREQPRISGRWTDPTKVDETVQWAADLLSPFLPSIAADSWKETLDQVAAVRPVTVHGELSEGQVLLDDLHQVTGIVDWDALHRGHPMLDFNFGVGGVGVHRGSPELRRRAWQAYVSVRAEPLPNVATVEMLWALHDATTLVTTNVHDPRLARALARLTEG